MYIYIFIIIIIINNSYKKHFKRLKLHLVNKSFMPFWLYIKLRMNI